MAIGKSLFERLRDAANGVPPRMEDDEGDYMQSILANLNRVLNTRQGQSPAHADLGIPAPSEIAYNFPDSIDDVQRSLAGSIEKYEPRLAGVRVIYVESEDDVLTLHFHISAKLIVGDEQRPVAFDATVGAEGRVNVAR
jgi:type VI secretion system protein